MAQCIDSSKDPYDILLDDYERGLTSKRIEQVFNEGKQKFQGIFQ
jgi:Zn-dependent M32 family carboxypeptidase